MQRWQAVKSWWGERVSAPPPEGSSAWAADDAGRWCGRCGATGAGQALSDSGCAFCSGTPLAWDAIVRLGAYEPPLDDWVRAMKYRRQWSIAPWLGQRLGERLAGMGVDRDAAVVTHVPMHWTRRWRRGFDQASLMAGGVAAAGSWPHHPLLRRVRRTAPQTAVPPSRRNENVRGAFAMAPVDLAGRPIVLVDDVKTSGATLSRCARLLRQHGAGTIHVAVAAVADPKGQSFTAV